MISKLLKWQFLSLILTLSFVFGSASASEDITENIIKDKEDSLVETINSLEPEQINEEEIIISNENTPVVASETTVYSRDIIISEVLPAPKNLYEKEFVELYNGGDEEIDLTIWLIDDKSGSPSKNPIIINADNFPNTPGLPETPDVPNFIIKSHAYLVFEFENVFNNTGGDSVRLLDPNNEVVSQVDYTTTKEDLSYSLFNGGWVWTTPTPGGANVAPTVKEDLILNQSISQIKKLEDGVEVITEGVVSVLPGILSTQYFYIQDQESGIQVYSYNKLFVQFKEGDQIRVRGELSTISGERRIKTDSLEDFTIILSGNAIIPLEISTLDVSDQIIGKYISLSGIVKSTSGKEFVLEGSPEIKVVIRETTNIVKPRMEKGSRVKVAGILSIYNGTFRILPIKQNDVTIMTSSELPLVGPNFLINLNIILLFYSIFILWNIFLKAKKKLIKSRKILHQVVFLAMFMRFSASLGVEKPHSRKVSQRQLV